MTIKNDFPAVCNTIDIPSDNESGIFIRCSSACFKNEPYIDIRNMVTKEDGILKTTQLGLTISMKHIDTVIDALRRLQLEEGGCR